MESFDAVILGAGAAGLMCAMAAGQRGRRVLLLDHADQAGAKILISGGGRCNFTNLGVVPERFFSASPHFAKSALRRYSQHDFVAMVERHRIPFHEKTLGQLFCDGSARAVVAMLLAECAAAGVDLRLGHRITDLSRAEGFRVETDRGSASFVLKGEEDIRRVSESTLLIADSHGVQFLIRDTQALDKASKKILDRFL